MEKLKLLKSHLFKKTNPEPMPVEIIPPEPVVIKNIRRAKIEAPAEITKVRNQPKSTKSPKNIAICFLTYGSIMHQDAWNMYIQNCNTYIHPKNVEAVDEKYTPFIIPTIIETEWAGESIVRATILLLKEAFKTTTNEWFILCSEDSFPLTPFTHFSKYLNAQPLSIFSLVNDKINKTSQWWAMRRQDVDLILQNEAEFNRIFQAVRTIIKKTPTAVDELFFLNALKAFEPNYRFKNSCVHYVKWLPNVITKHPVIFNRLVEEDLSYIKPNNCLFVRKTFPTFQNALADNQRNCVIMCVGSESIQEYTEFLNYARPKARIFVLSFIDRVENAELRARCDQMYFSVWSNAKMAIDALYDKLKPTFNVLTLLEKFDYRNINYPTYVEDEWGFLYLQQQNVFKLPPYQKPTQPQPTQPQPTQPQPTQPQPTLPIEKAPSPSSLEYSTSSSSSPAPVVEKEVEPPVIEVVPKKNTTKKNKPVAIATTKQVGTRKIKIANNDIANISPARFVKFGSVPINQRLPAQKDFQIAIRPMYMNNRKMFIDLINKMFKDYRDAGLDIKQNVSCEDLKNSDSSISLLNHQRIIRDYMNLITPYRGLLLYHGLGAGKTCSSIAIAEGFKTDRKVIIMTPASLNPNYMEELKKCGDEYYKKQQHWEWISVNSEIGLRDTLSTILQLPKEYIEQNKGAWVIDITKPNNYDLLKRPGENDSYITANQSNLNNQLNEMITNKYSFINYNGITNIKYNEEISGAGNPFNNKVVVIDEAHNLVSRIVNQLNSLYSVKQTIKPKSRKLVPMAVNIYKDLMSATNVRIVLLSGTPIINFPNEIAVLFNILRGYINAYEFSLVSAQPITLDIIKRHLSVLKMLDYIDFNPQTKLLTITANPFGFETVAEGVVFNTSAEHLGERQFPDRIITILSQNNIGVAPGRAYTMHYYTALPDSLPGFIEEFIKSQENNMYEFNNPMKFKKRIIGLTSYFRSAQEELLPRYDKTKDFMVVPVPMSDFQFAQYEKERDDEREQEQKTKGKQGTKKTQLTIRDLNKELQDESSSTFKIYSRLLCNFATPTGFIRPKPVKIDKTKNQDELAPEAPEAVGSADVDELMDEDANADLQALKGKPNNMYKESLKQFINDITADGTHITGEGLATNSPKLMTAMNNIQSPDNDGLHLVYSQFRTYEGIEIFARILSANGFAHFKIKNANRQWVLDIKPEDMDKPKYALYTGTEDTDEREILRNIYNGSWKNVPKSISDVLVPKSDTNNMGQHIKVLMITAAGSEGINLFNTRFVHLIDPYWNNVRLEQVIGRARRICSHQSLPIEKQTVSVFLYLAVLTETQYLSSQDLMHYDVSKLNSKRYMTSDETLYEIACIKETLNTKILHAVKEASIDCATHVASSAKENLICMSFGSLNDPGAFSYLPDIKKDASDEVYKQNVELIAVSDFKQMTRKRDGVKYVKQVSTGLKFTEESFMRAQQTNNLNDLIVFTE
jgi:hypothetical protein